MRAVCLILLSIAAIANADEPKKDAYLDAPVSAAEVKALQGSADPAMRKAVADVLAAEATPSSPLQSTTTFGTSRSSDIMTAAFIEAKVPDCLHSEGLKRQTTLIFAGYLALPFIPIAKLRGKCI